MRDLSLRVLLVLAAVALIAAMISSFALVTSQSSEPDSGGELYVYGRR
jgi:hypothetical protein